MVSPEQISASRSCTSVANCLDGQGIEIKGHIRGSSEPYVPDDGQRPHPGQKNATVNNYKWPFAMQQKTKFPKKYGRIQA
jgi:hypothetical protein